jgi:putative pyruvate formate lyase activating enzyme
MKTPREPRYLKTHRSGQLAEKVAAAREALNACTLCPRCCRVNRLEDKIGVCRTGRWAWVASAFPHFGEEDCLRGWRGSGTIFFSHCNLRCVFCQNFDISQQGCGRPVHAEELANRMLRLQGMGCHNINLVTPEHVVAQIVEALPIAIERGLRLPLVYNTSGYDALESLHLMDGLVDIYMPDVKFWDPERSLRYVKAKDYPEAARAAIKEMHRQVGDLQFDQHGLAVRGLLVRHLVMPHELADTEAVMRFLAEDVSPDTFVNIMAQYRPAWKAFDYPELSRGITVEEYQRAVEAARRAGLHRVAEDHVLPALSPHGE